MFRHKSFHSGGKKTAPPTLGSREGELRGHVTGISHIFVCRTAGKIIAQGELRVA